MWVRKTFIAWTENLCALNVFDGGYLTKNYHANTHSVLQTVIVRAYVQLYIRPVIFLGGGTVNILENRRRVIKKNVAILADSLPLSASRHNTMFLKNWQHLLYVYFSCVSGTNKSKQHHNKIKREGDFE